MRALIVTNMWPSPEHPALGSFVRDQVRALERIPGVELDLFAFAPGSLASYPTAAAGIARRYRGRRFDIVHAHYGLTIVPSLAARARRRVVTLHGTDLAHPRSRRITLASLRWVDLVATASQPLQAELPPGAGERRCAVLPCGVDLERLRPIARHEARTRLGLDPDGAYLLFPADPRRPEKRYDRALELAGKTPLLGLGDVDPSEVPLWINAANAVLVPSEREGFGLAVLEALACDVPVLATPVGIAPEALAGIAGAHCAPFDLAAWRAALAPHLADPDPRLSGGRERARRYSSDTLAGNVVDAWSELLGER